MSDLRRYLETQKAIEELPDGERELALRMYFLLVRVERLTFSIPSAFGWLIILLGGLAAAWLDFPAPRSHFLSVILALFYAALCWSIGFILAWRVCNHYCSRTLHELRGFQISDNRFYKILGILKDLDGRMFKNIGKLFPKVE